MDIKIIQRSVPSLIIRLPKGHRSPKDTNKTAALMSEHMMKLIDKTPEEMLTHDKYLELLQKVTYPLKPDIIVKECLRKDNDGLFSPKFKSKMISAELYKRTCIGAEMSFHMKNLKINVPKDVIVHESRHLFDYMCNSKLRVNRNLENIIKHNSAIFLQNLLDLKNEFCNIIMPNKTAYETCLEPYTNEEKIGILRDVRYMIKSEINAYGDMDKMFLMKKSPFLRLLCKSLNIIMDSTYYYRKRLKIVEKLLRKYIEEERKSLSHKPA